ncbi:MAG: NmrA family NAD(P)-binding protein [Gammaproteobacteria bacterium]|nr:NmrA family NAD(P)-binding protein [Gammaproteobacteria bacterium]MCP4088330.1 NmrA family NAD(P)-binding protein [Gammaproteobacteria bacterium]MCP4276359.1 NmrA family NAD(P)-binding protein [Gammaproteobacteria bacterium]MCP4831006.1 NmrA family NAD(P)-binding protein [Gammaproteobacteria bacterium]MCP4927473.1 NmrA family NAD(P)-binding protein [Gammaproteobacteria bacterium]
MDRDTAIMMAQQAIKEKNKGLVNAVLQIKAEREQDLQPQKAITELPLIAVTCSTGWECYAIVEELTKTLKYRVRALYRTPGTQAAERLETLLQTTEAEHPGLLTLHSGVDMNSEEKLTAAFKDCDGVVLYCTANEAKAGKITNHGNDPVNGRIAFMRQVTASLAALQASPSVKQVITLVFPPDKVTGLADTYQQIPWWMEQRLVFSDFLRDNGINVTCIHRPAYYYAMHRVDYTNTAQERGESSMSKTRITENNLSGINDPDVVINWVDVRDVGKWCGTCFEYPDVFLNENFSIASCAMTGNEAVAIAERTNKHGTTFKYKQFPLWLMKFLSKITAEVVYPLRYSQWYGFDGNAYDFESNDDLADLEKIHPRWSFEEKLESWGITEIKPGQK